MEALIVIMAYCGILPNLAMEEASEFNEIDLPEPKKLQGCRYDPLPTLFYIFFLCSPRSSKHFPVSEEQLLHN